MKSRDPKRACSRSGIPREQRREESRHVLTYEDTGVSIDRGDDIIRRIAPFVPGIGGFGGRFALDVSGYEKPILIAGADGVGTKIKIAVASDAHENVGIDLVAMNVNDILCSGAKPLFFLDYISSSRIQADVIERLVRGMGEGCRQAGCSILGGETAEMPGFYAEGDYDLAGFAVGIVEQEKILGPEKVREGDVLLGVYSSGLHSNGFSLARKVLADCINDAFGEGSVADELSRPTKIYVSAMLHALEVADIHAIAHITGGGIPGNIIRVMPDSLGVEIDSATWNVPEIFRLIEKVGNVSEDEMRRTFNLGIGMILVLPESQVSSARRAIESDGEKSVVMGRVTRRGHMVSLCNITTL